MSRVALMLDGETVMFSRDSLKALVERHAGHRCSVHAPTGPTEAQEPVSVGVAELAARLEKPVSSVRRAVAAGVFGDANQLGRSTKAYTVPTAQIAPVATKLRAGTKLADLTRAALHGRVEGPDQGGVSPRETTSALPEASVRDTPSTGGAAAPEPRGDANGAGAIPALGAVPPRRQPKDAPAKLGRSGGGIAARRRKRTGNGGADLGVWRSHLPKRN